ncbi:MAG: tetratricopeptide repeat protein [Planctomycetes bacterium]|nr:tetratricopeptide repeat protein [Planctomycetota bacterium]
MNRLSFAGWMGLCFLATTVSAAEDPFEGLFFPTPDAVVTIDAKTTATATEIIPPCFARDIKGTKLEVNTTHGWGWVERKQLMNMKEAEKYCEAHKTQAFALYIRSTTHLVKDQVDKSLADLNAAIKADPKFAPAYYGRGGLYSEKQEFAKALADFKEAVKLAPKDLLAGNDLAWFRATCPDAKFRDGKEAVAEATRICVATDHKQEDFLDTLAAAYAEVGDFKNAVEWATKLTKLDPENDEFKDRLKLYKAKKPFRDDGK